MTAEYREFDDKAVLITGGTGSFGRHFIPALLAHSNAPRVVIYSRDEFKQYELQQIFAEYEDRLRFFIGDVRDQARLALAMRGIDIVIHAATLKTIAAAEYNPFECMRTNVGGAENVVHAALRSNVARVLALSTGKAVNPVSLYGASKLAAEKIFVAANNLVGNAETRFSVLRYGNVLGSRGSVIPLFRKLVREGAAHLPITDPRMTRFAIAPAAGGSVVASAIAQMRGGEIIVPKLPSIRLVDIAHAIAPKLAHKIIGIGPGEKLHEVMITEDDSRLTLELPDRYVIEPAFQFWTREAYTAQGARTVADGFTYASDRTDNKLEGAALAAVIETIL